MRSLIPAVFCLLTVALLCGAPAWAGGASFVETPLIVQSGHQWCPAIDQDKIVWSDSRNGNYDIYMYDLTTGQERQITSDSSEQVAPAICGSLIAWEDYRNVENGDGSVDIYLYDLATGQERALVTNPATQHSPAIYGSRIVWVDNRNGNWDIYMYDIASDTETRITSDSSDQFSPAVYGDKIVWEDHRNGNADIYVFDIQTGAETCITDDPGDQYLPAIYGDRVVWEDYRNELADIYLYDLSTGEESRITTDPSDQHLPSIFMNRIVWQDYRHGNADVYVHDLTTGRESRVTADPSDQREPVIYGDTVVWCDWRNGNRDIYTADVADRSAPALATATITGNTLLLTYDEDLDPGSVPTPGDFSVKVAGGEATVVSVGVSGPAVTLTLQDAVPDGEQVTLDYTPGSSPIKDPAGNEAAGFAGREVANLTDTTPPTAPSHLTAAATSLESVQLAWTAASDSRGVVAYAVYRGTAAEGPFEQVATVDGSTCSYRDTGLTPETTYYYHVTARDAAGNWSKRSNTASVTTSDTEPPSAPGNLRAAFALSGSKIVLNWDPAADNFGVISYAVYRSEASGGPFENLGSLNGSTCTYEDAALTAATTYYYYVTAADAAGNSSGPSNTAVATKPASAATICISVTPGGGVGEDGSYRPAVSAGGRYISFTSYAENLVAGDANRDIDIFVRDTVTGQTRLVSAAADGTQGNGSSGWVSSISLDGRYVAFESWASNLVPGDTNNKCDIFVKDMETGYISRVSVASGGAEGNGDSRNPAISADGRYVAFESNASNLVPGDTNGAGDIFVHDRLTGVTKRVSVNSGSPSINADGRYVAYQSLASNLISGDTNGMQDIFLHDLQTGSTTIISKRGGTLANGHSFNPSVSADGRYISFESVASNLVDGDTNNRVDIFVYDRVTGQLSRVSVGSDGSQGNYDSWDARLSADGRLVVFTSRATKLVPGDTNDWADTFLHDRLTGETLRVSVSSDGTEGDQFSYEAPSISPDGGYVAFTNFSWNLVPGDENWEPDVFLRGPLLPADTEPPSVPGNVAAAAAGFSQTRIDWDASTDNVWVMGYFVYRATVPEGPFAFIGSTSSGTDFLDTGLVPNTTYYYKVEAYDASGNFSGPSEVVSVSTPLSPPVMVVPCKCSV